MPDYVFVSAIQHINHTDVWRKQEFVDVQLIEISRYIEMIMIKSMKVCQNY